MSDRASKRRDITGHLDSCNCEPGLSQWILNRFFESNIVTRGLLFL